MESKGYVLNIDDILLRCLWLLVLVLLLSWTGQLLVLVDWKLHKAFVVVG